MNNISRNKVLISIIAILLLTNISMLVFMFMNKCNQGEEPKKPPGFTERLRKEVKFDSLQMNEFDVKKKDHWKKMRALFDTMTTSKEQFYKLIYDSTISASALHSGATVIGLQQKSLDLQVFGYFRDIRRLCTEEQRPRFDSVLPSIVKKMTEFPNRK